MRALVVSLLAVVLPLLPCRAGASPQLLLSMSPDSYECALGSQDFATVHVIWSNYGGQSTSVSFGAALSPNSGYAFAYSGSAFNVTGDPESGFIVNFGSCLEGSVNVMSFFLYRTSSGTACSSFHLTPYSTYESPRYTDCDNVQHIADRTVGLSLNSNGACTNASAPHAPYPPDGATDVPLLTTLEWSFDLPQCGDISGREDEIYFGTTAEPPLIELWGGPSYPLAALQPSTTYYWKIHTRAYGLSGTSPVWSFTTTITVSTHQSTWGAIKALYR